MQEIKRKMETINKDILYKYEQGQPLSSIEVLYNIQRQKIDNIINTHSPDPKTSRKKHSENKIVYKLTRQLKLSELELYNLLNDTRSLSIDMVSKHHGLEPYDIIKGRERFNIKHGFRWTKTMIVSVLKYLYHKGEPINSNHLRLHHSTLSAAIKRKYGSLAAAIKEAGLNIKGIIFKTRDKYKYNKEQLKNEIKTLHEKNYPLNIGHVQKDKQYLYYHAKKLYHSEAKTRGVSPWALALEHAGIDYKSVRKRRGRRGTK